MSIKMTSACDPTLGREPGGFHEGVLSDPDKSGVCFLLADETAAEVRPGPGMPDAEVPVLFSDTGQKELLYII